jgi:hypothetical protein
MTNTPSYWIGSLAMAAALAVKEKDVPQIKRVLQRTLDDFMRSGVASEELLSMLREERRR